MYAEKRVGGMTLSEKINGKDPKCSLGSLEAISVYCTRARNASLNFLILKYKMALSMKISGQSEDAIFNASSKSTIAPS